MRRLACLVVLLAKATPSYAYPFLPPRPVPNAIAGPTDPHVAAIFYNPAALGPLRGLHVHLEGGARLHEGSIDRAAEDGQARGSAQISWSDFDSFAGLSWDLNTDSFTIGLAVHTPLTDLTSFGNSPVRYHAMRHTSITLEESAAAAFRLSSRFFIGAAANFAESWIDYQLARDAALAGGSSVVAQPNALCGGAPCGFENPLARQTLHLRGFGWGIGFSVGVLVRRIDRLWLALAYISHVFNTGQGGDLPLTNFNDARVVPVAGQGAGCPDVPNGSNPPTKKSCSGNDSITTAIPDILQFGMRIEVNPRFDLEAAARWVHYGTRTNLDVELQGGSLAQAGSGPTAVPTRIVLDRGLQDAWGLEVSGRWKLGEKLRLSPSLFFESSAVDTSAVNAAAIDAPKFDVALTAEWHPVRHLVLGAHVGGTAYVLADAGTRFDPRAGVRCVDASYSLDACGPSNRGDGLPSASGRYTLFVVHAGAAIGVEY